MKNLIAVAVVIAAIQNSAEAQDATYTGQISFSNLIWGDGSSSSGHFDYTYDGVTDSLLSISAADITTQAGSTVPAAQFYYSIAGDANNIRVGQDYNNSSQREYEAYFIDSATGKYQIFLDWSGVGNSAQLVATTPGNFASISANGGSTYYTSSQIGTSVGTLESTPEPGSLALAGLGAVGLLVARRKK